MQVLIERRPAEPLMPPHLPHSVKALKKAHLWQDDPSSTSETEDENLHDTIFISTDSKSSEETDDSDQLEVS